MKRLMNQWRAIVFCIFAFVAVVAIPGHSEEMTFPISQSATITDRVGQARILVDFGDLSVLAGKRILYAKFVFYLDTDTCSLAQSEVAIEPVTKPWSAHSVSWTAPWDSAGGDFTHSGSFVATVGRGLDGTFEVLLTPLVQSWANGRLRYAGLILVPQADGCNQRLVSPGVATGLKQHGLFVRYTVTGPSR